MESVPVVATEALGTPGLKFINRKDLAESEKYIYEHKFLFSNFFKHFRHIRKLKGATSFLRHISLRCKNASN